MFSREGTGGRKFRRGMRERTLNTRMLERSMGWDVWLEKKSLGKKDSKTPRGIVKSREK